MSSKQKVIEETNELMEEKLATDITEKKVEKYDHVTEQFMNDEISEEEYEQALDDLFESGDDFLEHVNSDGDERGAIGAFLASIISSFTDASDEIAFRAREVAEVVAVFGTIGVTIYVISATNGFIIPILIPLALIIVFWATGLIE